MKAPPSSPRTPPKARPIFVFVFTEEFYHFQPSKMDFCCPLFLFSFLSFFFILSFALCRSALLSLGGEFTSQYPAQHSTRLQKLTWMSIHSGEKFSRHALFLLLSSFQLLNCLTTSLQLLLYSILFIFPPWSYFEIFFQIRFFLLLY